jgi:hypothetical protein
MYSGGEHMLDQLLFWCAVLSAVMGMNSPDGNLFFFFAVHLTMVATGLFLHRREKRNSRSGAAATTAAVDQPSPASKTLAS